MNEREEELICFEHVRRAFGEQVVFEDLCLGVRRSETLAVIGGSGLGKSVLLKMLIGLIKPDAGTILFDGIDIAALDETALLPIRRRISMLFQGSALFDSLNVRENVAYPLRVHFDLPEDEVSERVAQKLALVGLEGIEMKMPNELSGGMQKRVAIARAIAGDPEVVLYDEPTTGLDPLNTRRVCELIRSIQAHLEATSLVITHDLASASFVADRVALVCNRRVATPLPTTEFMTSSDPAIREFVNAMPSIQTALETGVSAR